MAAGERGYLAEHQGVNPRNLGHVIAAILHVCGVRGVVETAVAKSDNCIILDVASDKVDDTEWERAPVMGTREDRGVFPD